MPPSPLDPMTKIYQWSIAALATVLVAFVGFYANTTEQRIQDESLRNSQQDERLIDHTQRLTTLEESKRNQEQLLIEIKDSIRRVEDAIRTRR